MPARVRRDCYEQFGQIHIYDLAAQERQVPIEMAADLTEVRPRFQNCLRERSAMPASRLPACARCLFAKNQIQPTAMNLCFSCRINISGRMNSAAIATCTRTSTE